MTEDAPVLGVSGGGGGIRMLPFAIAVTYLKSFFMFFIPHVFSVSVFTVSQSCFLFDTKLPTKVGKDSSAHGHAHSLDTKVSRHPSIVVGIK